jgi:hypothetical protein
LTPRFIDVLVDEHDQIPEGCCMRFQTLQEPCPVHHVRYARGGGPVTCHVESPQVDGSVRAAWAALVEDSGAGSATLIYGDELGLRLRPVDGGETVAESYLLLAHEAVID